MVLIRQVLNNQYNGDANVSNLTIEVAANSGGKIRADIPHKSYLDDRGI